MSIEKIVAILEGLDDLNNHFMHSEEEYLHCSIFPFSVLTVSAQGPITDALVFRIDLNLSAIIKRL